MSLVRRTVWFVAAATSATVLTLAATALLVNIHPLILSVWILYSCLVHFGSDSLEIVGLRGTYKPKQVHESKAVGATSSTSEKEKVSTEEDKEGRNEELRNRKAGSAKAVIPDEPNPLATTDDYDPDLQTIAGPTHLSTLSDLETFTPPPAAEALEAEVPEDDWTVVDEDEGHVTEAKDVEHVVSDLEEPAPDAATAPPDHELTVPPLSAPAPDAIAHPIANEIAVFAADEDAIASEPPVSSTEAQDITLPAASDAQFESTTHPIAHEIATSKPSSLTATPEPIVAEVEGETAPADTASDAQDAPGTVDDPPAFDADANANVVLEPEQPEPTPFPTDSAISLPAIGFPSNPDPMSSAPASTDPDPSAPESVTESSPQVNSRPQPPANNAMHVSFPATPPRPSSPLNPDASSINGSPSSIGSGSGGGSGRWRRNTMRFRRISLGSFGKSAPLAHAKDASGSSQSQTSLDDSAAAAGGVVTPPNRAASPSPSGDSPSASLKNSLRGAKSLIGRIPTLRHKPSSVSSASAEDTDSVHSGSGQIQGSERVKENANDVVLHPPSGSPDSTTEKLKKRPTSKLVDALASFQYGSVSASGNADSSPNPSPIQRKRMMSTV